VIVSLKSALGGLPSSVAQIKVEAGANLTSYTTSAATFLGGAWTKNEAMAAIGLIFVALTYFTSLYFQRRREKRDQEFHQHRIWVQNQMVEQDKEDSN
jgi:hypothetical protein